MNPKISIITPLHNKGRYIAETIESVVSQSFADWELIIVENGSTDGGEKIASELAASDPRIHVMIAPPEVRGPGAARNLGLKEARGTWIQFLDADDLLLPGHFEHQISVARENPRADLITCNWLKGPVEDDKSCELKKPSNWRGNASVKESALVFTPWAIHAAWLKHSALGCEPWWDIRYDTVVGEDHLFWFKVLISANLAYSDHTGAFYRTETEVKRHRVENVSRYLDVVDQLIQSNLAVLESRGIKVTHGHRKALLKGYISQLRRCINEQGSKSTQRRIKQRIKQFRPGLLDSITDWNRLAILTYLLPVCLVARMR
jgi:glycosyltransferase involved in cell wall biosynthesis